MMTGRTVARNTRRLPFPVAGARVLFRILHLQGLGLGGHRNAVAAVIIGQLESRLRPAKPFFFLSSCSPSIRGGSAIRSQGLQRRIPQAIFAAVQCVSA